MSDLAKLHNEDASSHQAHDVLPDNRAQNVVPLRLNVADLASGDAEAPWVRHDTHGRHGAEIALLYESPDAQQRVALVRCEPGAFASAHLHCGHETFHVLSGTFHDDHGEYGAGDIVVYPPGSTHGWTSPTGALILAIWGGPVSDVAASGVQPAVIVDGVDMRNCYPFVHTM